MTATIPASCHLSGASEDWVISGVRGMEQAERSAGIISRLHICIRFGSSLRLTLPRDGLTKLVWLRGHNERLARGYIVDIYGVRWVTESRLASLIMNILLPRLCLRINSC